MLFQRKDEQQVIKMCKSEMVSVTWGAVSLRFTDHFCNTNVVDATIISTCDDCITLNVVIPCNLPAGEGTVTVLNEGVAVATLISNIQ